MTPEQLRAATSCTPEDAAKYCAPLRFAMARYGIGTPRRVAHFLGQITVESGRLLAVVESLNYSVQGLANTWPSRFAIDLKARPPIPNLLASQLGRTTTRACNQEQLANNVYADRMGNGSPATGDGWKYRGRGLKQLTGKENYARYQEGSGNRVLETPDLLLTPGVAADSAAWFWHDKGLNALADKGDIAAITKKVNGGQLGILERTRFTQQALKALAAS